jgi:hypothetical protein
MQIVNIFPQFGLPLMAVGWAGARVIVTTTFCGVSAQPRDSM